VDLVRAAIAQVSRKTRPGLYCGADCALTSQGVPDRNAHTQPDGMTHQVNCTGELRGKRQQSNLSLCQAVKLVEHSQRRRLNVLRRVNPHRPFDRRDKRPFEMDTGQAVLERRVLHRPGQDGKRLAVDFRRRGDYRGAKDLRPASP